MQVVGRSLVHVEVHETGTGVGADDHVGIFGDDLRNLLGGKVIHHVHLARLVSLVSGVVVGDDNGLHAGKLYGVSVVVVRVLLEQEVGANLVLFQHERSIADTGFRLLLPALACCLNNILLDRKVNVVGNQLREVGGYVL